MTTVEQQIAALDETAIDYCRDIINIESEESMRTYFWWTAQGWLMVIGLRKAQLKSAERHHGIGAGGVKPVEYITWLDAETRDAWASHKEAIHDSTSETMEAEAVGFLIAETEDRVVLAAMASPGSYAGMIGIPKIAITKRQVLK